MFHRISFVSSFASASPPKAPRSLSVFFVRNPFFCTRKTKKKLCVVPHRMRRPAEKLFENSFLSSPRPGTMIDPKTSFLLNEINPSHEEKIKVCNNQRWRMGSRLNLYLSLPFPVLFSVFFSASNRQRQLRLIYRCYRIIRVCGSFFCQNL